MIACQFGRANICSTFVERRYELETLRRSLAMLRPGAPALDREEAMRLVRELQDLERQLRTLRRGLQELLSESR
jgi:vacuolar-type H+-ATPase subunit D/Vma8